MKKVLFFLFMVSFFYGCSKSGGGSSDNSVPSPSSRISIREATQFQAIIKYDSSWESLGWGVLIYEVDDGGSHLYGDLIFEPWQSQGADYCYVSSGHRIKWVDNVNTANYIYITVQ